MGKEIIKVKKVFLTLFLCCINMAVVFSQYAGQFSTFQTVKPLIQIKAYSFDLCDVKLLDSRFKENMERDGKWLLSIDNNRLLPNWRVNANIHSLSVMGNIWRHRQD